MVGHNIIKETTIISRIGSKRNGTVRKAEMLGAIENRLYLCSAFETQMPEIEY